MSDIGQAVIEMNRREIRGLQSELAEARRQLADAAGLINYPGTLPERIIQILRELRASEARSAEAQDVTSTEPGASGDLNVRNGVQGSVGREAQRKLGRWYGVTYHPSLDNDAALGLWKQLFCPIGWHLFDESQSLEWHGLYCDACELEVPIEDTPEVKSVERDTTPSTAQEEIWKSRALYAGNAVRLLIAYVRSFQGIAIHGRYQALPKVVREMIEK